MRRFLISSARFSWFGRRPEHLVAMLDQFDRLPADTPNRAAIAALLVRTTVSSEMFTALADRVERLITIVDEAARQPATWATIRPVARAACLLAFLEQGTTTAVEEVMSELDQLAHQVDTNYPHAAMMTMIHLGAKQMRSRFDGDIVGVSKVTDDVKSLHEDLLKRGKPEARVAELMAAAHDAAQSCLYGDLPAMDAALGRTTELRRRLPKADDARTWAYVDEGLRNLHAMRAFMDADSPDRMNAPALQQYAAGLRRGAGRRGISATADAAFRVQLAGLGVLKSFDDGSDGSVEIDVAIGDLRAAVTATPQLDPRYVYVLMTLGAALVRRSELCASPRDLTEGIELLEQAKDHAGDPANQYWAPLCMMLGWAHRQAGRNEMANQIAHGGLRGHLAKVLLQSRTGAATAAAREAAADAVDVACWCLEDGDVAGAALALDAGRGLTLAAATRISDVEQRLTGLGEPELAMKWRDAVKSTGTVDHVDIKLRRTVIHRLAVDPRSGWRELAPAELDDVREALTTLHTDAQIHLLALNGDGGVAIVIPARGQPTWLKLPNLSLSPGTHLHRYLATVTHRKPVNPDQLRDIGPDDPGPRPDVLDGVCDWAWTSVIGPLLDHLSHRHGLHGPRPPRLVLVPTGELRQVPWHAARSAEHGQTRYAVERATFSYAVSATSLCDTARLSKLPIGRSGLVIADPDHQSPELPGARAEAEAVHAAFYPHARFVGRRIDGSQAADGPGDRVAITHWLNTVAEAGGVLHAACHAVIQPRTDEGDSSYLQLARGQRLTAEELMRRLNAGHHLGLALAVLSACSSNATGRDYDEALSIATTFLASGTRTVISSLWSVPDSATSVLMFLFHHHLHAGLAPTHALRAAQLWMINPDRKPPSNMPVTLSEHLIRSQPTSIESWAGFVHLGH